VAVDIIGDTTKCNVVIWSLGEYFEWTVPLPKTVSAVQWLHQLHVKQNKTGDISDCSV
jgi:hypothetical protein